MVSHERQPFCDSADLIAAARSDSESGDDRRSIEERRHDMAAVDDERTRETKVPRHDIGALKRPLIRRGEHDLSAVPIGLIGTLEI